MRILFTRFPLESTYGGAEVQTLSLMKGLRERGHDVSFLGSCPTLLAQSQNLKLKTQNLHIGPPPVTKWGAVSFWWRQNIMQKALTSKVQSLTPPPDAIGMLSISEKLLLTEWAVQQGIRVVWIEHDRVGAWLRWNPWLPKLRRLSKLATTVVVSDLSKRIYVELGWRPDDIVVIPNGIDLERFSPVKDSIKSPHPNPLPPGEGNCSPFHIGCIARLSWEKGVDLLIGAIKDLPNVHLTIVGTGREEHHLRRLAQRITNNGQQITIVSSVPDVATFYRSLDVFVLPSRDHDPCPLAPIEAIACGIPTIMTDACGTAEYVQNEKEAIVIPAGSVDGLHDAIVRLMNDADLRRRLAERGPQVVTERFSMERMVGQYEKFLMKI